MGTKNFFKLSQSVVKLYMPYIRFLSEKYGIRIEYIESNNLETEEDYYYYIYDMLEEIVNYVERLFRKEKTYTRYLELKKEYHDIYSNFMDFKERTRWK